MASSRLTLFESPLFLGFDQFEKTFERIRKTAGDGYPPYNIEQIGEDGLRITLAVAGFSMEELDVQVESKQLVIRGRQKEEEGKIYLHRGIAARQFQRSFILADGIEVRNAALDSGLLHIDLIRLVPEPGARKIAIQKVQEGKNANLMKGIEKEKT